MVASGIRVGTPSVTTQGMGTEDMAVVGELIGRALREPETAAQVAAEVGRLVAAHPAYDRTQPERPTPRRRAVRLAGPAGTLAWCASTCCASSQQPQSPT